MILKPDHNINNIYKTRLSSIVYFLLNRDFLKMDHRINFVYPYVYQISKFKTLTPAFGWQGRKSERKIENIFFKTCKSFPSCYKLIYIYLHHTLSDKYASLTDYTTC